MMIIKLSKQYLQITKPFIILGNIISLLGGFFLSARGKIDYIRLFTLLSGMSLLIASSCIFNNCIDRNIDKKMKRTQNRAIAKNIISTKSGYTYGILLNIIGLYLIYSLNNVLILYLSIIGFLTYVFIYSLYLKKRSVYSTIVGSLAGAMPPVIGYCANSYQFDIGALLLLILFSIWQMPHFYSISILRFNDYQSANIPILPVKSGISTTKLHIILYIIVYAIISLILNITGYVGYYYLLLVEIITGYWLIIAFLGYHNSINNSTWSKKLLTLSIIVMLITSIMMSLDYCDNNS
ncbi:heme o synthase [Candidatus Schneideria nysicola]|nr:heme o synthase [Candidatus Schneideria nysicola]UAJ65446.1 heme o synthase [Candidatus Schneideria nysicola]